MEKGTPYKNKELTAGYAENGRHFKLVQKTPGIPLKKGISLGLEREGRGFADMPTEIATRVKHPQPTKPDGTVTTGFNEILFSLPEKGRIERRGDDYTLSEG